MGKKTRKTIFQLTLAVLVIVLQVLSIRISFFYQPLLDTLDFGPKSGGLLIAMESLSLLSGIALAWLPYKDNPGESPHQGINVGLIVLFIFTFSLVIIKVLLIGFGKLWSGDLFITLLPTHSAFGEWLFTTPVPALVAGFSYGSLFR